MHKEDIQFSSYNLIGEFLSTIQLSNVKYKCVAHFHDTHFLKHSDAWDKRP
jgi:hypothetical protein